MWPSRSPRWWPVKSPRPLFAVSAGSLRPGWRRWRCQGSLAPARGLLLKCAGDRMDVISAYREAGSYRGAAAISGTTPKTVRRVIARHEAGGGAAARAPRERNYDVVTVLVAERVGKTAGRISAKRLLPAARAAGYAGSARNFRRLVEERKRLWRQEHHRGRRPAVWSPREHLVTGGGAEGGLHVFCAVLAW